MRHPRTVSSVYGLIIRADATRVAPAAASQFMTFTGISPSGPPSPSIREIEFSYGARARVRGVWADGAARHCLRVGSISITHGQRKGGRNAERVLSCQRHFNETAIRNRQHLDGRKSDRTGIQRAKVVCRPARRTQMMMALGRIERRTRHPHLGSKSKVSLASASGMYVPVGWPLFCDVAIVLVLVHRVNLFHCHQIFVSHFRFRIR